MFIGGTIDIMTVLVISSLLGSNIDTQSFKEEKFIFIHSFSSFNPWLAPRQKWHGRGRLLTSWWPGRRAKGGVEEKNISFWVSIPETHSYRVPPANSKWAITH